MASPNDHDPRNSTPTSAAKGAVTIGHVDPVDAKELAAIKKHVSNHLLVDKFFLLNSCTEAHFIKLHLNLISERENLEILSNWSSQNNTALNLFQTGSEIWSNSEFKQQLNPVGSHQLVKEELHKYLDKLYLVSLSANPTYKSKTADTNIFIQKLRLLLIIRSLDYLNNDQIVFESYIKAVSILARKVMDLPSDPRWAWIEKIKSSSEDFDAFCFELGVMGGESLILPGNKPNAKDFFRSVRNVGQAHKLPKLKIHEMTGKQSIQFIPDTPPSLLTPFSWPSTQADEEQIFRIEHPTGNSIVVRTTPNDVKQTRIRNKQHGTGIILDTLEEMLFLRCSWHHLSKIEEKALLKWVQKLANNPDPDHLDRIAAAIILIAIVTSRTAHHVDTISISEELLDDWSVHPKTGMIQRIPPRFRGWEPDESDSDINNWISPRLGKWEIELMPGCTKTLVEYIKRLPKVTALGELWHHVCPSQTFQQWLNERLAGEARLERISGPALAHVMMVRSYEATANQGFTRLLGSQPRTALPAACAYYSYRSPKVLETLNVAAAAVKDRYLYEVRSPDENSHANACGSQMDIDLAKIKEQIVKLTQLVNILSCDASNWVDYHNKLIALVVIALYASTGGRPVNSPFQSLLWFDFTRGIVFLADKEFGPSKSSRICVLSDFSMDLIQRVYLPHLHALERFLSRSAPNFSSEIANLRNQEPEVRIPLFFFLRAIPQLDWMEVNETQLTLISGLDWPVPWNLFRHVHATQLVRRGVHPEVVDALLGHGDRGVESHGDFSVRVPSEDLQTARPVVNALQQELGFVLPMRLNSWPQSTPSGDLDLQNAKGFGRAAREEQRQRRDEAARKQARLDIKAAIAGRNPEVLSGEEWEEIAKAMLLRKEGFPHAHASLRYDVFESYIDELWAKTRKLTRMRRRFTVLPEPKPHFNEQSITAPKALENFRQSFERVVTKVGPLKPGPTLAAILACVDLVLTSKVAFLAPLRGLIHQPASFRVVRFQESFWFEWSDSDQWRDGRPILRVPMSSRAARWATIVLESGRKLTKYPVIPTALTQLAGELQVGDDLRKLLQVLVASQDQQNAWAMPGIHAAHLGGRQIFSAMPHHDWYRSQHQIAPLLPKVIATDGVHDEPEEPLDVMPRIHKAHQTLSFESTPEHCASIFTKIERIVLNKSADVESRRADLQRLMLESGYGHGDMPFIAGNFSLQLLSRNSKRRREGLDSRLQEDTVGRYFQSLKGPICEIGHDANLADMDADEITELYMDMLDWWEDHFEKKQSRTEDEATSISLDESPRLSPIESAQDAARRTLQQLKELHAYAMRACGAEEPDWSQISCGNLGSIGRPGYVLLSEYTKTMEALLQKRSVKDLPDEDISECFSLFACARFGLRIGESVGLYNTDWVEHKGASVLLVRANYVRGLKTVNGRRKIPLIGRLDSTERQLIDELFRRFRNSHAVGAVGPLLPGVSKNNFKAVKQRIGQHVRDALKAVTCNPDTTVHMLRHSFGSRVLTILMGRSIEGGDPISHAETSNLRRLLLGSEELDRRALWAVCRLLGHRSPGISVRCYLHGIENQFISSKLSACDTVAINEAYLINLDKANIDEQYKLEPTWRRAAPSIKDNQMVCLLKCWRLLAMGYSLDSALLDSNLERHFLDRFVRISGKLRQQNDAPSSVPEIAAIQKAVPVYWPISIARFDFLISLVSGIPATSASGARTDSAESDKWELEFLETIGRLQHIVLFTQEHLTTSFQFVEDLCLGPQDVALVQTANLADFQRKWAQENMQLYLCKEPEISPTFKVSAARSGPLQMQVPTRFAAIPRPKESRIQSAYELMFLWLAWATTTRKS